MLATFLAVRIPTEQLLEGLSGLIVSEGMGHHDSQTVVGFFTTMCLLMGKVAGAPARIRDAYSSRFAPETCI